MFLHACLRVARLWRMGCLVLCGFFLCFGEVPPRLPPLPSKKWPGRCCSWVSKGRSLRNAELSLEIFRPATWAGGDPVQTGCAQRQAPSQYPRCGASETADRRAAGPLRASAFVAVDQEGGRVARFQPGDGFPAYPSAAELGRARPMPRAARPRHGPHVAGARGQSQFRPPYWM